jgi:hypothetical protein
MPEPKDSGKGIRCRGCGCRHFAVVKTRRAPRDRVMRTRECRNCGQHLVTYEAAAGERLPAGLDELTPKQRENLLVRLLEMFGLR